MRAKLNEDDTQSDTVGKGDSGAVGEVKGTGGGGEQGESVGACKGGVEAGRPKVDKWADDPPKPPKGSSITLDGSGDHSGRDGWNSMSLADFYKVMLYGDHGRKL